MLMDQSSRDDTLVDVGPPGPSLRDAVSRQSSRDKQPKRSLRETLLVTVGLKKPYRVEGKAISDRRYPRAARINEVLREVIADEVERLSDPRLGFVTIMGVEVSADLKSARVFYSVLDPDPRAGAVGEGGREESRDDTAKALAAARVHLQAALGRQVRLKYLPRLEFVEDPSVAAGQRIDDILRQLHEEDR